MFAAAVGSVSAFGFEDAWVSGGAVAPADVVADGSAGRSMVGMVAVRDGELAAGPECASIGFAHDTNVGVNTSST
jgi:hypothetical protein